MSRGDDDAFPEELSRLVPVREGLEFTLYRDWQQGNPSPVLVVALAAQYPSPQNLQLLEHEYWLTSEVDSGWAAKPLALTRQEGSTILVLKDSGGKPSVRFFCHAKATARSGPLVLPSEVSGLDDFPGFLKYDPYIETLEEWGRVVEASEYIPVEHLGTTDDSRFLPLAMILPLTMTLPLPNPGTPNLLKKGIGGDL